MASAPSGAPDEREFHVTPVNDLREHAASADCWCEPEVRLFDGARLVIHDALDGRA